MLVPGVGAGCRVPVLVLVLVETGCWCWVPGAGAGAVSWLRTWWRQGAAGCARGGDRVPGAGAGCWLCAWWRGFFVPQIYGALIFSMDNAHVLLYV